MLLGLSTASPRTKTYGQSLTLPNHHSFPQLSKSGSPNFKSFPQLSRVSIFKSPPHSIWIPKFQILDFSIFKSPRCRSSRFWFGIGETKCSNINTEAIQDFFEQSTKDAFSGDNLSPIHYHLQRPDYDFRMMLYCQSYWCCFGIYWMKMLFLLLKSFKDGCLLLIPIVKIKQMEESSLLGTMMLTRVNKMISSRNLDRVCKLKSAMTRLTARVQKVQGKLLLLVCRVIANQAALDKAKYMDGLRAVRKHIQKLEQDLELLKAHAKRKVEFSYDAIEETPEDRECRVWELLRPQCGHENSKARHLSKFLDVVC